MTWSPDIVIYHKNCADGFGAAWACWKRWPEAQYIAAQYGDEPPPFVPFVDGPKILIVDFSYKQPVLEAMAQSAHSVVVLDHHKTAEAELADFTWHEPQTVDQFIQSVADMPWEAHADPRVMAYFDMEKSGARLAWEFAHPDKPVPDMIALIEDRDLWLFNLHFSKPFAAYLRAQPYDFEVWDRINYRLEDDAAVTITQAVAMQEYHDAIVQQLAAKAELQKVGGHEVPCVNVPGQFASDVGHAMLAAHPDAPYVATYFCTPEARVYSLRSQDHRMDVSEIAKRSGGGGHRNAAGFKI